MHEPFTYKKPSIAGFYFINAGDVVTDESLDFQKFVMFGGELVDEKGTPIRTYHASCKYSRVLPERLNEE